MDLRFHKEVSIPVGKVTLKGDLVIPLKSTAIIIFSHGSGSSRLSNRNQMVAKYLQRKNFGTLLFDLLTALILTCSRKDWPVRLSGWKNSPLQKIVASAILAPVQVRHQH